MKCCREACDYDVHLYQGGLFRCCHEPCEALLWSFIFCFIVMTVWAMLIVEMINPIIKEPLKPAHSLRIAPRQEMNGTSGAFADCDECLRATSSVMNANLLLFKTVIAGDSWGQIAVPVIQPLGPTRVESHSIPRPMQ